MIYFNTNQSLFKAPENINPEIFHPKFGQSSGFNFQLHTGLKDTEFRKIKSITLINMKGDLFVLPYDDIKIYYVTIDNIRYINIISDGADIYDFTCGFYSLKIEIDYLSGIITRTKVFYSNYFSIDNKDIVHNLTFDSSTDFDNKFYNGIYSEKMIFLNDAISQEATYIEEFKDTGEIKEVRESQIFAEEYTIRFFTDYFGKKFFDKCRLYDNIRFNYLENVNTEVLNIECATSYNEEIELYEIELTFNVNQIILNCSIDYNPQILLLTETINDANDSGDPLWVNNTNDEKINNDSII